MKKTIYVIVFLLVINICIAQESIYDFIKRAETNPYKHQIIVSDGLSQEESAPLIGFADKVGLTRSVIDSDFRNVLDNTIIVGNTQTNSFAKKLIGRFYLERGEGFIIVRDNNLIIAGAGKSESQTLLEILDHYEKNKNLLLDCVYIMGDFELECTKTEKPAPQPIKKTVTKKVRKETNLIIWVILMTVIIGGITALEISRKPKQKTDYPAIEGYITQNLKKGFTKTQIKQALLQKGWSEKSLNPLLNKIK